MRGCSILCLMLAASCGGKHDAPDKAPTPGDSYVDAGDSVFCGNDTMEPGELCDGVAPFVMTCPEVDATFTGGELGCNATCDGWDITLCAPRCGNGTKEGAEVCDGSDFGGDSCHSIGLGGGPLACTDSCEHDTTDCFVQPIVCGDNVAEAPEECDGTDLPAGDCDAMGYSSGTLACLSDCSSYDTTGCVP